MYVCLVIEKQGIMATFKKQKIIGATKQEVWKVLSCFGTVYKFHPGVRKSYIISVNKEGIGATRICELLPIGKVSETVKEWRAGDGFSIEVTPIEKLLPTKNLTSHFSIEKLSVNTSRVIVYTNYKLKLGVTGNILNKILIQPKLEKSMDELLRGLKTYVEKKSLNPDSQFSQAILKSVKN